jgi:hypothetical protein
MAKKIRLSRAEKAQRLKDDQEFEARYQAKQERKNIEKFVAELDVSIGELMSKAVRAKQLGVTSTYKLIVNQLRMSECRKRQAESFLLQLDAMMDIQKMSELSQGFLTSMNAVLDTLGPLVFDSAAMDATQKRFQEATNKLSAQSEKIDMLADGNEMAVDISDENSVSEAEIDARVNNIIADLGKKTVSSNTTSVANKDIDKINKFLQTLEV